MKNVRLIKITVCRNAIKNNKKPVQQRMSAMSMTLFTARKKANHTLQTMRLQHLRLYTAANIPEPVNDGLQIK